MKRPPIGIKPKFLHDEQRLKNIKSAMERYYNAGLKIPIKWVVEYNDLIKISFTFDKVNAPALDNGNFN